jgi:hypothetical protein
MAKGAELEDPVVQAAVDRVTESKPEFVRLE